MDISVVHIASECTISCKFVSYLSCIHMNACSCNLVGRSQLFLLALDVRLDDMYLRLVPF